MTICPPPPDLYRSSRATSGPALRRLDLKPSIVTDNYAPGRASCPSCDAPAYHAPLKKHWQARGREAIPQASSGLPSRSILGTSATSRLRRLTPQLRGSLQGHGTRGEGPTCPSVLTHISAESCVYRPSHSMTITYLSVRAHSDLGSSTQRYMSYIWFETARDGTPAAPSRCRHSLLL